MAYFKSAAFSIFCLTLLQAGQQEMERLMQAVMVVEVGWTHAIRLQDIPIPKPGNNQILIDILAAGIGPVDEYMMDGSEYNGPPIPAIPGKEIAGLVHDIHESVTLYKKYDRIFCGIKNGGYAEYAVADETDCYPLTRNLSYTQGAALYESYFNAYRALIIKAGLKNGETLLIHGARGGLGVALIQVAKCFGATVVVSVIDKDVEIAMKKAGADHIVHYNRRKYLDAALNKIHKVSLSFDVIFEFTIIANLKHERNCLAVGGRIIKIDSDTPTTVTSDELKTSKGVFINFSLTESNQEDRKVSAEFVLKAADAEQIKPIIGNEYRLEQAIRAHDHVSSGVAARGKSVFSTS